MIGTDTLVVQGIVDRAAAWQERVYAYERAGCRLTVFEEEALVLLGQFRLVCDYDALLVDTKTKSQDKEP